MEGRRERGRKAKQCLVNAIYWLFGSQSFYLCFYLQINGYQIKIYAYYMLNFVCVQNRAYQLQELTWNLASRDPLKLFLATFISLIKQVKNFFFSCCALPPPSILASFVVFYKFIFAIKFLVPQKDINYKSQMHFMVQSCSGLNPPNLFSLCSLSQGSKVHST